MLRAVVCKLLFSHSKNQLVEVQGDDSLCLWKPRMAGRGIDDGPEQRAHLSHRQVPGLQGPLYFGQSRSSLAPPCMLCDSRTASSPSRILAKLALEHLSRPSFSFPSELIYARQPSLGELLPSCARHGGPKAVASDTPGLQSLLRSISHLTAPPL